VGIKLKTLALAIQRSPAESTLIFLEGEAGAKRKVSQNVIPSRED